MDGIQKNLERTNERMDERTNERYGEPVSYVKYLCDLGVGGQKGIVYYPFGICSALTATQYKDPHKILIRHKKKDKTQIVLNPMPDGTCRTLKNQYYKNSISNFES